MSTIQSLQEAINQSQDLVFFGGAGVSTASGIPDFRSASGIFNQDLGGSLSPEMIISHDFFCQHTEIFFDFYFKNLVYPSAQPNIVHRYLAKLEETKNVTVITQNIDGLHQEAGSKRVIELHGSVQRNYCLRCGHQYSLNDLSLDENGIPRCPIDGGLVRPDVTLYQESLNDMAINQAIEALRRADFLIVAGTSLMVYPAASFIHYYQGDGLAVINKTPLSLLSSRALIFEEDMVDVFKELR